MAESGEQPHFCALHVSLFSLGTQNPTYPEELSMAIQFVFTSVFRSLKCCFYSFALLSPTALCCLGSLTPTADVWSHNSPSDILSHNGHASSSQPGPQSLVSRSISWSISASSSNDAENLVHPGINENQYEQQAGRRVNILYSERLSKANWLPCRAGPVTQLRLSCPQEAVSLASFPLPSAAKYSPTLPQKTLESCLVSAL